MKKQHQNPSNQQPLLKPLKLEIVNEPEPIVDEFQARRDAEMKALIKVLTDTTVEVVRLQKLVMDLRTEVWDLKSKVEDQRNLRATMVIILDTLEDVQSRIPPRSEQIEDDEQPITCSFCGKKCFTEAECRMNQAMNKSLVKYGSTVNYLDFLDTIKAVRKEGWKK